MWRSGLNWEVYNWCIYIYIYILPPSQGQWKVTIREIMVCLKKGKHQQKQIKLESWKEVFEICRFARLSFAPVSCWCRSSLDAIYVDGDHSYEGVAADLSSWWPTLKPGGFLAGHAPWWNVDDRWGSLWCRCFQKIVLLFGVLMAFSKTSHALCPREGRNGRMWLSILHPPGVFW